MIAYLDRTTQHLIDVTKETPLPVTAAPAAQPDYSELGSPTSNVTEIEMLERVLTALERIELAIRELGS